MVRTRLRKNAPGAEAASSYAVPKEVGKVGTESPAFIQPISQRQDGIQAMFAKQNLIQGSPAIISKSNAKRQRSTTPKPSTGGDTVLEQSPSNISPVKRRKVQRSSPSKPRKVEEVIDLCDTEEEEESAMEPAKQSNSTKDVALIDSDSKRKEVSDHTSPSIDTDKL